MDSGVIKIALIGVGAYLLYEWAQSNGYWAQWFGGSSTFTDPASLQTYCTANPNGSATMTANGQSANATCAQWMSALKSSSAAATPAATTTPVASTTPATSAVDPNLVAQLTAGMVQQIGQTQGSVSQWNWVLQNILKSSLPILVNAPDYTVDQPITATQYLQERAKTGLSGLGMQSPYGWGSRLVN